MLVDTASTLYPAPGGDVVQAGEYLTRGGILAQSSLAQRSHATRLHLFRRGADKVRRGVTGNVTPLGAVRLVEWTD